MSKRFDWVTSRLECRSDRLFSGLWERAAEDVETANRILAGQEGSDIEQPFNIGPEPPANGALPSPGSHFAVSRARPSGVPDAVVFTLRQNSIVVTGFGHPTAVLITSYLHGYTGRCVAEMKCVTPDGARTSDFDKHWQLLRAALEPLFFWPPGRGAPAPAG